MQIPQVSTMSRLSGRIRIILRKISYATFRILLRTLPLFAFSSDEHLAGTAAGKQGIDRLKRSHVGKCTNPSLEIEPLSLEKPPVGPPQA